MKIYGYIRNNEVDNLLFAIRAKRERQRGKNEEDEGEEEWVDSELHRKERFVYQKERAYATGTSAMTGKECLKFS